MAASAHRPVGWNVGAPGACGLPALAVAAPEPAIDLPLAPSSNGRMKCALLRCLVVAALAVSAASARVVRVEVASRGDVLDAKPFGLAGSYEKLIGTVHFAIDPKNEANQIITDITLAPRNAQGEVEFSADLYILKPKQMARGNGAAMLEIGNRGRKGMLGTFCRADGSLDPQTAAHFGDGFLLRQGFTLVWVGWQFDPPATPGLMHVHPPQTGATQPVRGLVRSNFVVTDRTYEHTLADRDHVPYAVADAEAPESHMTVRQRIDDPPKEIPRDQWRFARMEEGRAVADSGKVWLDGGFEPGKIYEVVYVSQNPPVAGVGAAAVRDVLSQLKYDGSAEMGIPKGSIDRALGFGTSQSGRYLRTFLYYGFNRDEANRKVFDGVLPHVAGGGRGSFNHRFAQASRDAHPFLNFFYPTDIFPFSDVEQTDPETGLTDGLLTHNLAPEHRPKIFYTNSAYEYWGRAASLIHTAIDGKSDAALPETTRIYFVAGTQHGPSGFPPATGIGQQRNNPMDYRWALRALLVALDRWVAGGVEPPLSRYPHIADGTLVTAEKLNFPKIPGVNYSTRIHKAYRADYGPQFLSDGIVSKQPPKIGSAFPMLVPAVDADGNETSGIRLPELQAPLATYTGWNLFNDKAGPSDEISSMAGSYIPLARTAAERKAAGDPRPSIEERYPSRDAYLGRVSEAALELAADGYLLEEDVAEVLRRAAGHWDHHMSENPGPSGGL